MEDDRPTQLLDRWLETDLRRLENQPPGTVARAIQVSGLHYEILEQSTEVLWMEPNLFCQTMSDIATSLDRLWGSGFLLWRFRAFLLSAHMKKGWFTLQEDWAGQRTFELTATQEDMGQEERSHSPRSWSYVSGAVRLEGRGGRRVSTAGLPGNREDGCGWR